MTSEEVEKETQRIVKRVVEEKIETLSHEETYRQAGIILENYRRELPETFNRKTEKLVKAILALYPRLDSYELPPEILIPFVFNVAKKLVDDLEKEIPEEWK